MSAPIKCRCMFPVFVTSNLLEQKRYYETYFAFEAVFFEEAFYLHLIQPESQIQLGFLMPELANQPDFLQKSAATEGSAITFEVDSANHAYSKAIDLGLNVVLPFKEEEWGQRHFMLKDPAGLYIDIVEHF